MLCPVARSVLKVLPSKMIHRDRLLVDRFFLLFPQRLNVPGIFRDGEGANINIPNKALSMRYFGRQPIRFDTKKNIFLDVEAFCMGVPCPIFLIGHATEYLNYIRSIVFEVLYSKYYIRSILFEALYSQYYIRSTIFQSIQYGHV